MTLSSYVYHRITDERQLLCRVLYGFSRFARRLDEDGFSYRITRILSYRRVRRPIFLHITYTRGAPALRKRDYAAPDFLRDTATLAQPIAAPARVGALPSSPPASRCRLQITRHVAMLRRAQHLPK